MMKKCCVKKMIKSMLIAMVLVLFYILGMENHKMVDKFHAV